MLRKINTITWLLLALVVVGVKFFLLPDTALYQVISIGFAIVCGAGALSSLNQVDTNDRGVDFTKATKVAMVQSKTFIGRAMVVAGCSAALAGWCFISLPSISSLLIIGGCALCTAGGYRLGDAERTARIV